MTALVDFLMPSLGADMDEGTITEWLIDVGDQVERGDVVAIVETDKADIDIEVWDGGRVSELLVEPGVLVAVGTTLARLEVADDAGTDGPEPEPIAESEPTAEAVAEAEPAQEAAREPKPVADEPKPLPIAALSGTLASPAARRLAGERGIDLATVTGTGPGGAVVARDLEKARAAAPPRPSSEERMRRAIADLMTRSKREIPHYHLATEIDLEPALVAVEACNTERPIEQRILPAAVLMKAIADALADHREFNGFWLDDQFVPGDGVHLGIAVSLRRGGLVAPAIHDANHKSVDELMASLRDLVSRARAGRLRGSEMTDATVTITNLGDRGVEVVHGVIYPPQVALVGLGRIEPRPAVVDGEVVVRRQVTATLAADHRASDGQRGARFLNTIARNLRDPELPDHA